MLKYINELNLIKTNINQKYFYLYLLNKLFQGLAKIFINKKGFIFSYNNKKE